MNWMMENIMLQGFDGVEEVSNGAVKLHRIPETLREYLCDRGQMMAMMPAGNEIRLVPKGDVTLKLQCEKDANSANTIIQVFFGDFQGQTLYVEDKEVELKLSIPDMVKEYDELGNPYQYSPKVVRVILRKGIVKLVSVSGNCRKPNRDELPKIQMLSYGTSITQGVGTSLPIFSFTKLAARRLGFDHINLGFGGSALCEYEMADYLAGRNDWNIITLCISVNMLGRGFTLDEFRKRATYMVNTIHKKHPTKPVFCISPITYYEDTGSKYNVDGRKSSSKDYRNVLRNIVENINADNCESKVYYIDGRELLPEFGGLTMDMLHPGDYGAIEMGVTLSDKINEMI